MPSERPDAVRERRLRFGDVVRERRLAGGMSQEALAERCGVDRKSISRVETGAFSPSLDRVWRLADALGVSIDELFDGLGDAGAPRRRRR